MSNFIYKGKTKDGTPVEETVEAKDRFEVYEIARQSNHTVDSVRSVGHFSLRSWLNVEKINELISSVSDDQLVVFTKNLSAMLKAGLSISRALSVAKRQTRNPKLKKTITDLSEQVTKGQQLNEAMADAPNIFSKLYIAMVRAGEESGSLSEALATIGIQMERSSNLKKKIRGAMIYPAIVITVMLIIGVLMMIYVVPTLTATFRELDVDLPASTQLIIAVSDFLSNNTIIALILMVGAVVGFIAALRTRIGQRVFEWILLHLPVIGNLAKQTNAARTGRTLSSLLAAGVNVVSALEITEEVVQNSFYKKVIHVASERVEKGEPLSSVFVERDDLYPVLVGEMIAVGEETGQISAMLVEVADFYETEIENKTKDLSTIIEPVLMVVIGGVVGFFALAMIAPIYSISDSIG